MGHYWRDMDPEGADAHDKRMECATKCRDIQDQLRARLPMHFTVGDIGDVLCVLDWGLDNSDLLKRLKAIDEKTKP